MLTFNNKVAQWAFSLIQSVVGRVVVVYYIKRTTGEMRRMVCVWNEGIEGSTPSRNLLAVWDVEKADYRSISMNAVKKIVISGIEHDYKAEMEAKRDAEMVGKYENLIANAYHLTGQIRASYGLN